MSASKATPESASRPASALPTTTAAAPERLSRRARNGAWNGEPATISTFRDARPGIAGAVAPSVAGSGSTTRKIEPRPTVERASIVPFMRSTRRRVMASPSPVPSWLALSSPCSNSSNRIGMRSSGMPGPVSSTVRTSPSPAAARLTPTPPAWVNLMALPAKFTRICRTRSASPTREATRSSAMSRAISRPLSCARGASNSTTPSTRAATSKGSAARSRRPASMREKSRMPSTRPSSALPLVRKAST
ncbi:hypothetical protein CHKEEEPN_1022 [Methylorubrum podarium]|nr:hypothetical protein CHKEEEPN_1022 [Methylorubrum podarium]